MQTPTTAQIRTAIEVLKKFGEHINTNTANAVIALHESPHSDRQAAHMGSRQLSKLRGSRPSPLNWRTGATSCCNRGGSVFLIMFNTRHALPLRAEGYPVREAVAVHPQNRHAI
jgi:hypothetical protein